VLTANFCAGIISISFNYFSHFFWTFKSQAYLSSSGVRYLGSLVTFWLINTVLVKHFVEIGIDPKISKLLPILLIAPLSFLFLKFFVFRKHTL
jgi:putative flippase GtrA